MAIFEGAGVALITPFKENGEVNFEKLEDLVEEQIAGGTDAIIACGTTGESSTMTHEENSGDCRNWFKLYQRSSFQVNRC